MVVSSEVASYRRYFSALVTEKRYWNAGIFLISFLTGYFVWYNHGLTFSIEGLRAIWKVFNQHYSPATSAAIAMLVVNFVSTLYIWLFCQIGLLIGLGRTTVFLLFLLFNFNPEYNSVRLSLDPLQGVILLWITSMWFFLHDYREHFYRAFLLWAIFLLLAATIDPSVWLWILGFPLCFIFWPGSGRLTQRILERIQFITAFYLLCALLIWLVPLFHQNLTKALAALTGRLDEAMSAMSVFISDDHSFNLAGYDAFLIAWVLVVINAAKNFGLIILGVVALALIKRPSAVLPGRVWLFFAFSLSYATLIGAFSLLYLGRLQSDLLYVPVTMLALWMCAAAVFYLYQRWRTQRMAAQNRLVLFWLMVAYAIASMIQFGPSSDYLRDGGVWAHRYRNGHVFSNSYEALFFAGESPFVENNPYHINKLDIRNLPPSFGQSALLLFDVGRRTPIPDALGDFEQKAVFQNRRGDRLFVLALPE